MYSRQQQRLGGVLIFLIGTGFTIWNWYNLFVHEFYYRKVGLLFPMFIIIGLGIMAFPGYREERLAKGEDIGKLRGMQLLTPRWWVILGVALLAGGFNSYLLMRVLR
jgi:ABC-type Fe3+-siderophore transport system permease subunit